MGDTTPPSAAMSFTAVAPVTANSWHYEYDNLSRVTYACSQWDGTTCQGNEFHYAYDGAGNLTRFDRWSASTASVETVRYVINGANQIACVDDTSADKHCDDGETLWNYDKYGNLKSDGTNTYTYDAANRLSSISNASSTTTYTYNGDSDRISQSVNGTLTTYILDIATPLTMLLAESTGGQTTRYWHGLDTLAQSDGTSVETFAYDGLGSVRQLVGESGSVGLAQTFDPYGNGYAKAGSAQSTLGYTGEQTDSNGFVFLRARYYNPSIGRFLQMDPSRLEENPYLYGLSNPILHTDPSGLLACEGTENCNSAWSSNGSSSGGTLTLGFDIDPDYLIALITGGCKDGLDFLTGFLTQYFWDMTAPYRMIVPGLSIIMDVPWILSQYILGEPLQTYEAGLNEAYWTGSQAYRNGRDAGRAVSEIVATIESVVGAAGLIAGPGVALFGGGGIMISCPAIATVIGTIPGVIGCVASGGAVTVGVTVTAAGAVFAVHGAMVLSHIGNNPPGGKGGGHKFGKNGAQFTSKTYWPTRGQPGNANKLRLDAENPAPGQRLGQLHVNDDVAGIKYYYNPETGWFNSMPKDLSKTLSKNPQFIRGMKNALSALGEPLIITPP